MLKNFMLVIIALVLASCAHSPVAHKSVVQKSKKESLIQFSGNVLNQPLLSSGGKLGLTAFKAGPMAEANDELDRVSAMVIKGIKETLGSQQTSVEIIDSTQGQPDIALEGYVEELSKKGKLSRMMGNSQQKLVLVGDIWLVSSGKRLLEFNVQKKFNSKKETFMDVSYQMGQEIGSFIASHAKQKK